MLSFFPRDVLDEIWDLIESVSEGFPTYSFKILSGYVKVMVYKYYNLKRFDFSVTLALKLFILFRVDRIPNGPYALKFPYLF